MSPLPQRNDLRAMPVMLGKSGSGSLMHDAENPQRDDQWCLAARELEPRAAIGDGDLEGFTHELRSHRTSLNLFASEGDMVRLGTTSAGKANRCFMLIKQNWSVSEGVAA